MNNTANPIKAPIIDFYRNASGTHGASITQTKDDRIVFDMGGASETRNWATPLTGQWVHLAVTYNTATQVFTTYINGAKSTSSKSNAILMNDYNLSIGYSPDSSTRDFNGMIDEVIIWNRALSEQEIQTLLKRQTG